MKKNIFIKVILIYFLIFNYCFWEEINTELTTFIVTAYYSPLPWQSFYLKWSYEADIALNWNWTNWASGKPVYSWMIAAPKNYQFWTKIYLEWIWIWTVDDRWWAIVNSWNRWYDCDRLDIWMWYWEVGLKKALTWWKRRISWRILNKDEILPSLNIENFEIWYIDVKNIKNNTTVWKNDFIIQNNQKPIIQESVPFPISEKSPKEDIIKLQQILKDLNYFDKEIDWKFNNIKNFILKFQLDNNIIKNKNDYWAWIYWPKTKTCLNNKYLTYLKEQERIKQQELLKEKELIKIKNEINKIIQAFWKPKLNEIWLHIRKLQKTLKLLWYFEFKDTAIFWIKTKESIINYQLNKWIIESKNDNQAGKIWPNTVKSLEEDLFNLCKDKKENLEYFKS